MKKSRKTAIVIGVILLIGIYYYVTLPAINIHSTDTWFYIAGLIVFILVFYIIRKRMRPTEIRESKPAKAQDLQLVLLYQEELQHRTSHDLQKMVNRERSQQ